MTQKRVSIKDVIVSGVFFFISVVCLELAAFGCGTKSVNVTPTILTSDGIATVYEIPVEQVKDKNITPDPGKDDNDVIAVVEVPSRPDGKPTQLKIYKRQKSITKQAKEVITGDSGSPDYSVTTDNKDVTAKTERSVGLWPYLAGAFALIAGFIAARKWLSRFSWITNIVGVLRKFIGL